MTLILASSSRSRAEILHHAGVDFEAIAPLVDEDMLRSSMATENISPADQAMHLAEMKAVKISQGRAGMVIGADQMLVCDDAIFCKPRDIDEASGQLRALRDREHILYTALCAYRDGSMLCKHMEHPALTMRPVSDAFIDAYLLAEGRRVLESPGAYRVEGMGIQLFSKIVGDFFAVRGLPLLPLLNWLRLHGEVME